MQVKHEKRKCHLFLTWKFIKISNWGSLHLLQKMPIHVCGTCKRSQCCKRFCSLESSQAEWVHWLLHHCEEHIYIYLDLLMFATPVLGILVYTKSSMWRDEGHGFFLVSHWYSWSNWFFASLTTWGICLFQSSTIETALGVFLFHLSVICMSLNFP